MHFLGKFLLVFPDLRETLLFSVRSSFFSIHAPSQIPCHVATFTPLTFSHFTIWSDGSVAIPFGKDSSGVLAKCSLCGIGATLFYLAGPVNQVFPLKPVPFCKLSASSGKAISLLLPQTPWQDCISFSSFTISSQILISVGQGSD